VLRFVILLGVVNLFADLTYEGARSVTGPFLAQLGATAALISIISGAGEFVGYTLRAVAGYVGDRTGQRWPLVFLGYTINMLAVPAMALAGSWPAAACLIAAERTGRAIRKPIVQGLLAEARHEVGAGRAFGINESLDALGATVGPLVIAGVVAWRGSYRAAFATLLVSAVLCLGMLTYARRQYPESAVAEDEAPHGGVGGFPRSYWIYLAAAALLGFGFVDFSLIAFHLESHRTLSRELVPVSYAVAMGTGAIGNWVLGSLYDRWGTPLLAGSFLIGAAFTPLVFFGPPALAFAGMALWGFNKGAQDTLLKPAIAPLVPASRRSTAFGIFDTGFGVAWLAGSVALGLLYDRSLTSLVTLSVVAQLAALPLFVIAQRSTRRERG
jgi:predicted MFS family arabinose efflux permease